MADLDVRVYPIDKPKGNTVAFASVAFNDMVAIRGIRVVDGENGLFVSMPQTQKKPTQKKEQAQNEKKPKYRDVAYPVPKELKDKVNEEVINEYLFVSALPPDERGYPPVDRSDMMPINVDDVELKINLTKLDDPQGNTKAIANMVVDGIVAIRGVRIVESEEKGLFVTMPQSYDKLNDEFRDIAFPLDADLRAAISDAVMEKYEAADKSKDKSLADGLKKGAEKAAEQSTVSRESAAKSRPGIRE